MGTTLTTEIENISLDRDVRCLADWKPRKANERRELVEKLVLGDQWIIDGAYETTTMTTNINRAASHQGQPECC